MLSGATLSAAAMEGTAVFRIVVSNDSMKNATATNQGTKRALDALNRAEGSLPGVSAAGMKDDEVIVEGNAGARIWPRNKRYQTTSDRDGLQFAEAVYYLLRL
jgi:hypothetical protein